MSEPLVRAGETVGCPNGHPVFDLLCDVFPADTVLRSSLFGPPYAGQEPAHLHRLTRCSICRAPFLSRLGLFIHGRGWCLERPAPPADVRVGACAP